MGLFGNRKKVEALEGALAKLALKVADLEKELAEIKDRLPEYEEAVAKGVGDTWDRSISNIIDYNPLSKAEGGDD